MKRMICLALAALLTVTALTACGGGKKEKTPAPSAAAGQEEKKTVQGIINKIDAYLVLRTEDGEYQIMDYGKDVSAEGFAEGDQVVVTYTGELGVENVYPVILAIEKAG